MKRFATIVLVVLFVVALPLGTAQPSNGTPVASCTKACTPKAPEVNGETIRTGTETVKAVLFGHFNDILNRAPVNTQLPQSEEPTLNGGFLMPVINTELPAGAQAGELHFINTWFEMYSSAGLVEIQNGVWRTHQEPGVAEPVKIVGDTIPLYFYLSAYPVPSGSSATSPTGTTVVDVMPAVGVYARMETGRHRFDPRATVIAVGDTANGETGDVPTSPGRINMITRPNEADIYEFEVPMAVQEREIPSVFSGSAGFLVSINPYQIKGKADGTTKDWQVMQNDWRLRVGPTTPIHLVVEIQEPMKTKAASMNLYNDNLFVRWSLISPWGSYDVDDQSILGPEAIDITGQGVNVDKEKTGIARPLIIKRSVDHDAHFKPVNVTWKFDYHKAALPDGEYTVTMRGRNLQQTYELVQEMTFTMQDGKPINLPIIGGGVDTSGQSNDDGGGGKGSPGFEAIAVVAAVVGALGFGLRRRR